MIVFVVAAFFYLGAQLAARLHRGAEISPLERAASAALLGTCIWIAANWLLSAPHWLNRPALLIAAAIALIAALLLRLRLRGGEALMPVHPVTASIPLFPKLKATQQGDMITLRNTGDLTLKARTYGQPAYRLIAKWDGGDKWLELPKDLAPGEEVTIKAPGKGTLRLYHALESIPMLDPEPLDAL